MSLVPPDWSWRGLGLARQQGCPPRMFPVNFFDLVLDGQLRVRQLSSTVPLRRLRRQTEFGSAEWYRRFFIIHVRLALVRICICFCVSLCCSGLRFGVFICRIPVPRSPPFPDRKRGTTQQPAWTTRYKSTKKTHTGWHFGLGRGTSLPGRWP
jgi:hypothetical protein